MSVLVQKLQESENYVEFVINEGKKALEEKDELIRRLETRLAQDEQDKENINTFNLQSNSNKHSFHNVDRFLQSQRDSIANLQVLLTKCQQNFATKFQNEALKELELELLQMKLWTNFLTPASLLKNEEL